MVSSDRVCKYLRCIRPSRDTPVRLVLAFQESVQLIKALLRYLQDGNVLAARTFLSHFISLSTTSRPSLLSSLQPAPISVPVKGSGSDTDEIVFTTDPVLNFLQLAVRTCQRAQADRNKQVREVWIRLCGTYQSKGGLLAKPEVRSVSLSSYICRWHPGIPFHLACTPMAMIHC